MGKWKVRTKQRFWRVEVRFCSHNIYPPPPPPPHKKKFQKAIINTERPKKSVLKLSYPKKFLPKFSYPNKIPNSKISNPKKSFHHSCHLKFGDPPPGCSTCKVVILPIPTFCFFAPLFAFLLVDNPQRLPLFLLSLELFRFMLPEAFKVTVKTIRKR